MFKYIASVAAAAVLIFATEASSQAGPWRCRGGGGGYAYETASAPTGYRSFSYEPGSSYGSTGTSTSRRPSYMDAGSKARGDYGR
jgi:hypothetical protein